MYHRPIQNTTQAAVTVILFNIGERSSNNRNCLLKSSAKIMAKQSNIKGLCGALSNVDPGHVKSLIIVPEPTFKQKKLTYKV